MRREGTVPVYFFQIDDIVGIVNEVGAGKQLHFIQNGKSYKMTADRVQFKKYGNHWDASTMQYPPAGLQFDEDET